MADRRGVGLLDAYRQYVGDPFASMVGGAARGYLGLDKPTYANEEAYRTAQALGNMPVIGGPAGLLKAAAQAPDAAAAMAALLRRPGLTKGFSYRGLLDRDLWHGSNQAINAPDPAKYGSNTKADDAAQAFWAAGHEADANRYAELAVEKSGGVETMHRLRAAAKNPLVIGAAGESTVRGKLLDKLMYDKEAAFAYARKYGHDAVVWPIGNANDSDFTVAVLDPKAVKFLETKASKTNARPKDVLEPFDYRSVPSSIWD